MFPQCPSQGPSGDLVEGFLVEEAIQLSDITMCFAVAVISVAVVVEKAIQFSDITMCSAVAVISVAVVVEEAIQFSDITMCSAVAVKLELG